MVWTAAGYKSKRTNPVTTVKGTDNAPMKKK
jgi:hypothetical protein